MERQALPLDWSPLQRLREALRYGWADVGGRAFLWLLAEVLAERTPLARALRALVLVQSLPYRPDPPGVDVVQSASDTAENGGDCEDLAALLVILCVIAGVPARLLWLFQPDRVRDHVTSQVFVDGVWLWAECTVRARLGESPYAAAARLDDARALGKLAA